MVYAYSMKVIETVIPVDAKGEPIHFSGVSEPTDVVWSADADELTVVRSVANILASSRDKKFVKTIAIRIEL